MRPGDTLRLRYSVSGGLESGSVGFYVPLEDEYGDALSLVLSFDASNNGVVEYQLPDTAPYGDYELGWVSVRGETRDDILSSDATYNRNGSVFSYNPYAPRRHSLNFAVADFSVNGTATTLSGPTPSVYGHEVHFDVSVTPRRGGTPTGRVTLWLEEPNEFEDTVIGSAALSSGSARITTDGSIPAGSHRIFAVYNGSGSHGPSRSSMRSHSVEQADVRVDMNVPDGNIAPGTPLRVTATVVPLAPGGAAPEGQVILKINDLFWEAGNLVGGRASMSTMLPLGEYTVEAEYTGGYNHRTGTSAARTVAVSQAVGQEITVNQRTRHNQQRPVIAPLRRTAVVVYEDQRVANGPFGITAQRVNWTGAPNGPAIEVAPPAEGTGFPHVVQMAGGSWVVVWEAAGQGGRQDVFMRRFRANGRAMDRAARLVNDSRQGNQTAPRVAALEDGGYVVVWQTDNADGGGDGIAMRFFEASGAPRGDELTSSDGPQRPDVAVQSRGDIVVSWSEETDVGFAAYARRISLTGEPLGREIFIAHTGDDAPSQVRVTALDNGNYALAYEGIDQVMVQRMRQRGLQWGGPLPMQQMMDGFQRSPAITGLRRMSLATAWAAPDGAQNGIWVQLVGRDGNAIEASELANTSIARNQSDPAVSRVGTTRFFFVVWTTAAGTGGPEGTNIAIRRFMGP